MIFQGQIYYLVSLKLIKCDEMPPFLYDLVVEFQGLCMEFEGVGLHVLSLLQD